MCVCVGKCGEDDVIGDSATKAAIPADWVGSCRKGSLTLFVSLYELLHTVFAVHICI